jgi:Lrp/AsnC family transcriptional regulator, leucine-responsive regulatory protein
MDPIDYQILDLLQRDARTTQVQIADAVGLSQPSVADRIRKLDQSGVVLGYVARLDARQMGNDICAFVGVRILHPRHHDAFTRRILMIPDVLECHRVAGLDSYVLKIVSRNTATLDELISTLRSLPGVTRTTTTIVLATVKETTAVPLHEVEAAPRRRKEAAG